jgi:hypothetical protein
MQFPVRVRTHFFGCQTAAFTAILLQPVGGQIELKLESLLGRINVFAILNGMERRRRAKRKKESL